MSKNGETIKWISQNISKGKSTLAFLTFLTILNSAITTLSALITMGLVNTAVEQGNIISYIIYYGVFIVLTLVLQILEVYYANKLTVKSDISLRKSMLSSVMEKDYRKVQSYHSGDVLARATTDVAVVASGFSNILPAFCGVLVKIITALCVMFILDWQLALVLIIIAPITIIASKFYGKKIKRLHKTSQSIESENRSFFTEAVQNMTVIRAFRNQNPIYEYYSRIQQKGYKIRMKINVYSLFANVLMFLSVSLLYYFALIWGTYRVAEGILAIGNLTAILQLVLQFQSPFRSLSGIVNNYYKTLASAERLKEFTSIPEEKNQISTCDGYDDFISIDGENLSFSYDSAPVLSNLNFSIKKGEFVGIAGHSGIGKSTLLKLIIGLLSPTNGSISIYGKDGVMNNKALFSYVPQGNMILSGSIRENICFFNTNIEEKVIKNALEICCLDEVIYSLPNGLDEKIGEKGVGLSEGQVQRLSIARALVMGKKILLLDEATASLDETTEKKIIQNLKKQDYTVIMVTHHSSILTECDRVIRL